jgi:hypothetical protein
VRQDGFRSTGCGIADAVESGLWLDPKIGCGPAYIDRGRVVYDPLQPLATQLKELAEQAAIYRARRGLSIVRAEVNDARSTADTDDRRHMLDDPDRTGVRQRLRNCPNPADTTARMPSDEAAVRLRLQRKLPLGV